MFLQFSSFIIKRPNDFRHGAWEEEKRKSTGSLTSISISLTDLKTIYFQSNQEILKVSLAMF